MNHNWIDEFDGEITICDLNFEIIYMNKQAIASFSKYGGTELLGKNLLDCHNPQSCAKMKAIMQTGLSNCYTRVKSDGRIKTIMQSVTREEDTITGLIEISFYQNP